MEQPKEYNLTAHIPQLLMQQAEQYVAEGWFDSVQSLIIAALQRYLDTHQSDLNAEFIREDVDWGLRGEK